MKLIVDCHFLGLLLKYSPAYRRGLIEASTSRAARAPAVSIPRHIAGASLKPDPVDVVPVEDVGCIPRHIAGASLKLNGEGMARSETRGIPRHIAGASLKPDFLVFRVLYLLRIPRHIAGASLKLGLDQG